MSKEELEQLTEYEDVEFLSNNNEIETNRMGQLRFKSVNHYKRVKEAKVQSDGQMAIYANCALEYFGYRCALSGENFVVFDNPIERESDTKITTNLSAEHVVALATGGNDIIPNIVPSVLQYNIQKSNHYLLDWWPKAKDINGNSIYSPEKLLKLVNYMLKSMEIRKKLGIKKYPEEYREKLLEPNEIDDFLNEDNIAKKLKSETITATIESEDGKTILASIPTKDMEIPSLVKQKELKITEIMFLIDAIEVLEREEKFPKEIIEKLYTMLKGVENEIPFEIELRKNILAVLQGIDIENNRYTIGNSLLINSDILEYARENKDASQKAVSAYIETKISELEKLFDEEEIKLIIENKPELLYDISKRYSMQKAKAYFSKESFKEIIKQELPANNGVRTYEFVEALITIEKSGIDLKTIKGNTKLYELINNSGIKEKRKQELLEELSAINPTLVKEEKGKFIYGIGKRLSVAKEINNRQEFNQYIKEAIENGELDEESLEIAEISSTVKMEELIDLLIVLKEYGIDLKNIHNSGTKLQDLIDGNKIDKNRKNSLMETIKTINPDLLKKDDNGDLIYDIGIRVSTAKSKESIEEFSNKVEEAIIKGKLSKEDGWICQQIEQGVSTQQLVETLVILKKVGIDLKQIERRTRLEELLSTSEIDEEKRKHLLENLEKINPNLLEKKEDILVYNIGDKLTKVKNRHKEDFTQYIESAIKEGQFTEEDKSLLLDIKKSNPVTIEQFVQALIELKKVGIDLKELKRNFTLDEIIATSQLDEVKIEGLLENLERINPQFIKKQNGSFYYDIGERLSKAKGRNKEEFIQSLEKAISDRQINLSDEEIKKLIPIDVYDKIKSIIQKQKDELYRTYETREKFAQMKKKIENRVHREDRSLNE